MKIFKAFIVNLALVLMFAISLTAQSTSIPDSRARLIDTEVFYDEKNGIKDLVEIYDKLKEEFKVEELELKTLFDKTKKLQKELDEISKIREPRFLHESFLRNKITEYESAINKLKRRQVEVKSLFDKRKEFLTVEINKKIAVALKQFAKENNYSAIGDISEMNLPCGNGFCVCFDSDIDITNEFIQFYNSKTEKKIN